METGRELFNKFLQRDPMARPVFVPLLRGVTARVEGLSREALNSDPTLWANSLVKTAELLNLDGIVAGFDFTLMAERCGCPIVWKDDRPEILAPASELCESYEDTGRMKNFLEATKRVFQICRDQRGCVSSLTGPVTLANQVFGSEEGPQRFGDIKERVVKVVEAVCKTRPDILIFIEGSPLAQGELVPAQRRMYNTLRNVTSYYNIPAALYVQNYQPQNLIRFSALRMDTYILGPSVDNNLPHLSELWDLGGEALGIGLSLPIDDVEKSKEIIKKGLALCETQGKRNFLLTSLGPVTRDVDLEKLRELINEIFRVCL